MAALNRLVRLEGDPKLTNSTKVFTIVAPGRSNAGTVRLPGARVGDVILSAWKLNGTAASLIASYTTPIATANLVTQSATDRSADVILFVIKRGP
jgi:hypothetical protein